MKNIVFDCERMKYPHTGLYHYCLQLGKALLKGSDPSLEHFRFYVRPEDNKAFGADADHLEQRFYHKMLMPVKGADVWHTTYQATNYFPFRKKAGVVLTVHDLNVLHENKFGAARLQKELQKIQKHIDGANHIIAISDFTLGDIRKHLRLGNKPATVIHNGCNFQKIAEPLQPKQKVNGDFLFTLGTINPKKNFHVLLSLLENNNRKLVLAGITDDEVYKEKIIAEAARYNAADRLILTGPVSENDKQWYMQHCEAFVFPSLAEGFGLPVIEAMYFGKPVILSRLTALPEIGGDAAFYFDSFDPGDMRTALNNALQAYAADPTMPERIKARAALFTWEKAAAEYLAVYRSLC